MRILITGINGFVGGHLRTACLERDHDVYGIDAAGPEKNTISADLTLPESFGAFVRETSPDAVIHLAAVSRVDHDDAGEMYRINMESTINILSAAVKEDPLPRFLFVSSSQVYGIVKPENQPITEQCPVRPVNHYGAGKAAGEHIAMAFHYEHGIPLVVARPFNHTGKNQAENFLVPKLVRGFKEGRNRISLGNTDIERDFTDVRDVVRAYIDLIEKFPDGQTFNIACGMTVSIPHIIACLEKITGHKPEIIKEQQLVRKNDITLARGDYGRIKNETGWEPRYVIEETLAWMLGKS